jgi:hypothetical protein
MTFLWIEAARFLRCGRMRACGQPTHRATLAGWRRVRVRNFAQSGRMHYAQLADRHNSLEREFICQIRAGPTTYVESALRKP